MRFKGLDLNLLVAFEALMQTRSVSRAAERLHMSQPAMSAALSRLRLFFEDHLLVSRGKRMHPTAFAESLLPHVSDSLRTVAAMLATPSGFDPATSQRQFRIVASDYVVASILHPLVTGLAAKAPGVRIDIALPSEDAVAALEEGKIDLMITPDYVIASEHPSEPLYAERQLLVGWSENPIFSRSISEDDFFEAGHVAVAIGNARTSSFADRQLEMVGRRRRVEITAPFFTAVPWLLEGTMRLAILHERLVAALEDRFEIASAELPFAIPPMQQQLFYHEAREGDPGLIWLRQELRDCVRQAAIGKPDR
ncbi:MAG TPA: LysR family transcriptional regulator [Propylenella sp.]|nr:LysR family transcriptional regulator [Propylenella sp.]